VRRVTVVDYGMGNLLSVSRALEHCGARVDLAATPHELAAAEMLVLPGVGAFADGMQGLARRELVQPLRDYAATGRPLLGICLGMHMLMSESTEFGVHEGLGLIPGRVTAIPRNDSSGEPQKVPHIGWSPLARSNGSDWTSTPLEGLADGESFYFVHSFAASPERPENVLAVTSYGGHPMAAVVAAGNVIGTQFHPEKSGRAGLALVRNFVMQSAE
jgi:glutamine amidotransferase